MRLSTRSPKDSVERTRKFQQLLAQEKQVHSGCVASVRALYLASKVTTAQEAFLLLLFSKRIAHDLRYSLMSNTCPLYLAVREFSNFSPEWEFRIFVAQSNLCACCTYHRNCFVPQMASVRDKLLDTIYKYWCSIKARVPVANYSLDLVLSPDLLKYIVPF